MNKLSLMPLSGPFGVEVHGVDIARGVDPETLHALALAFVEHKVLLLRDQDLSPDAYAAFARAWGTPRIDGFAERNVPGFDYMSTVGNVGGVNEQEVYRNGASFWHTDCAAEADPDATTMLYCLQAPEEGGETLIADMQAAYEALDAETRREIDPLIAVHRYSGTGEIVGGREDWEHPLQPVSEETAQRLPPPARRPVARRHSVSGRKGLYSPAGSMVAIEGMEHVAAHRLMRRLKLHAVDDAFRYAHRYRPRDLLMWDNTATLHCARPIGPREGGRNCRLLHRIVPLGLPRPLRAGGRHSPGLTAAAGNREQQGHFRRPRNLPDSRSSANDRNDEPPVPTIPVFFPSFP